LGHKNTEWSFSSCGAIEEISHESNLSANVAFPDSFNLSLPEHVHDLVSSNGPPRRVDDLWGLMFGGLLHLAEESFGGPRVSFRAQHEIDRLACGIHRAVEVIPFPFDLT
jgi:hypothetical protein